MSDLSGDPTAPLDSDEARRKAHIQACEHARDAVDFHDQSIKASEPESQRHLATKAQEAADTARRLLRQAKGLPSEPPAAPDL